MPRSISQSFFLACPSCQGEGFIDQKKCLECNGMGGGIWLEGKFLYWGKKLNILIFYQEKIKRQIRLLVNILGFLFGFIGILVLGKILYDLYQAERSLLDFLEIKNFWSLFFWFSLIIDMYLVYRINKESELQPKIFKFKEISWSKEISWQDVKTRGEAEKIEVSKGFSSEALKIIEEAYKIAYKLKNQVRAIHLIFAALALSPQVTLVFARLGVDFKKLVEKSREMLRREFPSSSTKISPELKKILISAYLEAYKRRKKVVSSLELLVALSALENSVKEILYELEIDETKIRHVVEWIHIQDIQVKRWRGLKVKARGKPKGAMNRAFTAVVTPFLDQFSQDLTRLARASFLELCINRESEIEEIFRILETCNKGVVLVGSPGTGKSAIIYGIAQMMVAEEVPEILQDKRLISLSLAELVAGAEKEGELERRLLLILKEVRRSGNIVLFIDNIQNIIGLGGKDDKTLDLASVLTDELEKGYFFLMTTSTIEDYRRYVERSALLKVLEKVDIQEVEREAAIRILEAKAPLIEAKTQVYFSYPSLEEAVDLSKRYIHERFLPEKAIKLIEEAASFTRKKKGKKAVVQKEEIQEIVAEKTKIPVTEVSREESEKLLHLEEKIHKRIIDQDEAVNLVAGALRRARVEFRETKRPIASFLFLGPTGVGKTEVAKTVAEVYFGLEENMVRLDMSEYQGGDGIQKLIGFPGSRVGGYLTEAVRKSPFSLVLLDEIEKSNPGVLNLFLALIDDGRLTDSQGRTIDFTNTIIIGTSNAGGDFIQEAIRKGVSLEEIKRELQEIRLKSYFRPEFLNRLDAIVVFKPLDMTEVKEIVKLLLKKVAREIEEKGISLKVSNQAILELAQAGFDPTLGARPLRRVIQEKVESQLANLFLEKKIERRDKVVLEGIDKIRVEKAPEI